MRRFGCGEEHFLSIKIRKDIGLKHQIPQRLSKLPNEEPFKERITRRKVTPGNDEEEEDVQRSALSGNELAYEH
jgi:hypothetical protein